MAHVIALQAAANVQMAGRKPLNVECALVSAETELLNKESNVIMGPPPLRPILMLLVVISHASLSPLEWHANKQLRYARATRATGKVTAVALFYTTLLVYPQNLRRVCKQPAMQMELVVFRLQAVLFAGLLPQLAVKWCAVRVVCAEHNS
jgi:hypothetical protein